MSERAEEPPRPAGTENPGPAGLYVHVPFCRGKCAYCDFYSVPAGPERIARWLGALAVEASSCSGCFPGFDTLYLGGGTPSLLNAKELGTLLDTLHGRFPFSPDSEISLEANPDDVTSEKLRHWRALGVNRVSLGIQSLVDRRLELLGRRHDAAQALRALESTAAAGFASWGADVIFGLPGQTPDELEQNLERLLSFGPDHVSCYQLTLARDTPLHRLLESGQIVMPGEEEERDLFLAASRLLEERGYLHYEVSNFCRWQSGAGGRDVRGPGRRPTGDTDAAASRPRVLEETPDACRHNLKYWTRRPYLGLGPSAHSFLGNERWWNPSSLDRYCGALEAGHAPVEGRETLTPEQERMEALCLALRLCSGLPKRDLLAFPGAEAALGRLVREGFLEEVADRVVPTSEGFLLADHLPLLFLE